MKWINYRKMIFYFLLMALLLVACNLSDNQPWASNQYQESDYIRLANPIISENGRLEYLKSCQLFDSLNYFEEINDLKNICRIRIDLADLFRRSGNYFDGIDYLHCAREIAVQMESKFMEGLACNRLSAIFFELHIHNIRDFALDSAIFYVLEASEIAEQINDDDLRVSSLILNGAIHYLKSDFNKAETILIQAKNIYEHLNQKPDQALITNLGKTWLRLGKFEEAQELAGQFYQEAAVSGDHITLMLSLLLMEDVYLTIGDSIKTREIKLEIEEFNRKQEILTNQLAIKQLESKFQFGRMKNKQEQLERKRVFFVRLGWILAIIIINLMVFSGAIYYVYRQRIKTIRLENELLISKQLANQLAIENKDIQLQLKEEESEVLQNDAIIKESNLASKVLIISRHNEFLIEILERIKLLNLEIRNTTSRQRINEIIDLIRKKVKEKNWDEFEMLYASGNSYFVKNLNITHADLTSFEKRLCYLLHMNLTTKEISDITMQSSRAIEMARHRLRIKFKLERDENLISYLTKFSRFTPSNNEG